MNELEKNEKKDIWDVIANIITTGQTGPFGQTCASKCRRAASASVKIGAVRSTMDESPRI